MRAARRPAGRLLAWACLLLLALFAPILLGPPPAIAAPCHTMAEPTAEAGAAAAAAAPQARPRHAAESSSAALPIADQPRLSPPADARRPAAGAGGFQISGTLADDATALDAVSDRPAPAPGGRSHGSCCATACPFCTVPQESAPLPRILRKVVAEVIPLPQEDGTGLNPAPALDPPRVPA